MISLKLYRVFALSILINYWFAPVNCRDQDGNIQIIHINETYINSTVSKSNNFGTGSGNKGASTNGENTQPEVSAFSPYFGVELVPYVKPAGTPVQEYSVDELTTMAKVVLTKSHSILTMEAGYQDQSYTNGPWDISTASHISKLAANLNQASNKMLLTVNQGAGILAKPGFQPDANAAFNAAKAANAIFPNTVWGITLIPNYKGANSDEFPKLDHNSAKFVKAFLKPSLTVAHEMNVKLGVFVDECYNIVGGPLKSVLIDMARSVDYFVCSIFPDQAIQEPQDYFNWVVKRWENILRGFQKYRPNLEIVVMTGWATKGQSLSNPGWMNSPKKSAIFWNGMKEWAEKYKVRVYMHQAFDVPRNMGNESWGYWRKLQDVENGYEEKAKNRELAL